MLREIPQYVLYFVVYERSKEALISQKILTPGPASAVAGGLAGTMVWVPPFYSVDVIKTRLQSAKEGTYKGAWDCVVKSYKAEGLGVFFRGMGLAQVRAFLVHGSVFFLYERFLEGMKEGRYTTEGRVTRGGERGIGV
jgi:solute carrier family 25 (mitochondrial carnitine/acylcarnitine transporter), member 20/29